MEAGTQIAGSAAAQRLRRMPIPSGLSFDRSSCRPVPKTVLQDGGSKRCALCLKCARCSSGTSGEKHNGVRTFRFCLLPRNFTTEFDRSSHPASSDTLLQNLLLSFSATIGRLLHNNSAVKIPTPSLLLSYLPNCTHHEDIRRSIITSAYGIGNLRRFEAELRK